MFFPLLISCSVTLQHLLTFYCRLGVQMVLGQFMSNCEMALYKEEIS